VGPSSTAELVRSPSEKVASGALVLAGGWFFTGAVHFALVDAADKNQPAVAHTLNLLDNNDFAPLVGGLAVMLLATGIATLLSPVLPRWLGWVSIVIGVLAVAGPLGMIAFPLFFVWVLVVSILLARSQAMAGTSPP
jgi:hypothetical protein